MTCRILRARRALAATAAAVAATDSMAADSMAADSMGGDAMAASTDAVAPARYEIVFSSRWTEADHPLEYPGPKFAGLSVAHFSPIIGASHAAGYALFAEGAMPSPGLENLSENGKHSPLDEEIKAAMGSGKVLELVENAEPLKDHSKTLMAQVAVDEGQRLAFVAGASPRSELLTLDVANPRAPRLLARTALPATGSPSAIALDATHLVVAMQDGGVYIQARPAPSSVASNLETVP
jgi:hypothetical protein